MIRYGLTDRRVSMGVVPFALLLLMVTCNPAAAQQQTYTLKIRMSTGERWAFDITSAIKQKGDVTANGQQAQAIDTSATERRKGTIEILAVADGKPTAMKITFDPESSTTGSMNGQPAPAFALAGKTVTLRKGDNGAVTNDLPDQPDPQTLAELNRMLDPDTSVYPTHPVALNDEWDADTTGLAKQFQLGQDDKVSMKCKLLAVKDQDGRQVADVSVAGNIVKHDQGFIETTTTLGGVSRVDVLTGQVLNADIIGKMSSRGSRAVNGQNGQVTVAVNADGTLEIHERVNLQGGGQPVAQDNAPPMKPADAGRDNPLAPHGPPSFAGAFKGDELSIDLTGGAGDRYTGTLTLKDKKFPVTAHAEDNRLMGTFQSGGSSFDFSATLDGDGLKLTSGGSDYTMRRAPGAENPLGRPEPKNPLGQ
ncbi:MAG TPA: hypothetical protein VGI81_17830 [Tepidisphaeraceae bacterium]|jgi:hypothetical protein